MLFSFSNGLFAQEPTVDRGGVLDNINTDGKKTDDFFNKKMEKEGVADLKDFIESDEQKAAKADRMLKEIELEDKLAEREQKNNGKIAKPKQKKTGKKRVGKKIPASKKKTGKRKTSTKKKTGTKKTGVKKPIVKKKTIKKKGNSKKPKTTKPKTTKPKKTRKPIKRRRG